MASGQEDILTPSRTLDSISGKNVLLLVPPVHPGDLDGCLDLLSVKDPSELNVWSFGVTLSPNHRVEQWERTVGESPGAFRIVSATSMAEDEARDLAVAYNFDPEPYIFTIRNPGALPRIGLALREALEEWEENDRHTVVCFHSISSLSQYASDTEIYQLLNTMTSDITSAGALAHYHLDPGAHDGETLARYRGLFDAIIEPSS
jgi:hypothetical protein